MLTTRSQLILHALIDEYIQHAMPIGSAYLRSQYDWGFSPATIRAELSRLEQEGFLTHPHTSAGRIPTDQGYEFFVQAVGASDSSTHSAQPQSTDDEIRSIDDVNRIAQEIHNHSNDAVLASQGTHTVQRGVLKALQAPEFSTREAILDFLQVSRLLENETGAFFAQLRLNDVSILIGKQTSDYLQSAEYSIMASKFARGDSEYVVAIYGPKRMNYQANLAILRSLL